MELEYCLACSFVRVRTDENDKTCRVCGDTDGIFLVVEDDE